MTVRETRFVDTNRPASLTSRRRMEDERLMRIAILATALLLVACSPGETASEAPKAAETSITATQPTQKATPPVSEPTHVIPPQSTAAPPSLATADMSLTDSMPACEKGLKAKGLTEPELHIMLGPMAGVCPNNGVSEGRIREILTTIWTQAGCHQHGPIEVAKALDSGACGGDAG